MISVGFVGFEKRKKVMDIFKHMVNKFSKEDNRVKIIDKEEKSSKQYYLLDFSSLIRQV